MSVSDKKKWVTPKVIPIERPEQLWPYHSSASTPKDRATLLKMMRRMRGVAAALGHLKKNGRADRV